ncbi:MAG TPA: DUF1569 domain-containing protein [Terracidiphilus sp.]|nr:DUF1569 domain-containing protein [Terracidiphilus sp.]
MRNLYEQGRAQELKNRIASLRSDSPRQWGKMGPAQAMAHCAATMEMAVGDNKPPRMFVGRLIGAAIKRLAIGNEEPLRRNAPTSKVLLIKDDRDMKEEQDRLCRLIDRFAAAGPAGCTRHPHTFFGRLTPEEWSVLMDKHLDHHLRQFGA